MSAKRYNFIKLTLGLAKGIISFTIICVSVAFGITFSLEEILRVYVSNQYAVFLSFVFVFGLIGSIVFFPVNIYLGFFLEHKYNLSNQTFYQWIREGGKGLLVGTIIGVPILLLFYYILNSFQEMWWLPFAVIMFIISVILAQIVPILILPLFYKIIPLTDDNLKDRIINLAVAAGIKVEAIYKFDMSKNTKKANAALTGLGKTKRIILGDTLFDNYELDEIETVVAHELGHFKHKHILKNILIGTVFSFLTFFLIAKLYGMSVYWFGFESITQIAALPLLALWGTLLGVIQTPITNFISRKFEYQADRFAVLSTGKPEAFIKTLEKLTDQNLGDKLPHPLVEWYFYSHPSLENRRRNIELIKND